MTTHESDDRAILDAIASALDADAPASADLARDRESELIRYPFPLLQRWAIYGVDYLGPYHEVLSFVGWSPGEPALSLTGLPDHFTALLRADDVRIERPEDAVAVALAFIETTRDMRDLVYVVAALDELRFLPQPDDDERAAIEHCRATLADTIAPPSVVDGGPPFQVVLFLVREQALERHTLTVAADGAIADEPEVVAHDLPLVFSR